VNEVEGVCSLHQEMLQALYTIKSPTQYTIPRAVGLGGDREIISELVLMMGLQTHLPLIQRVDHHFTVHHGLANVPETEI
jgi:hypothetical protein